MNPTDWQQQLQSGPYKLTEQQARNFVAKVRIGGPADCWEWTASRHPKGYGQVRVHGRMQRAHRVVLATRTGCDQPGRLCACHCCDNPGCVNPAHLWWGTHADNVRDKYVKGRAASGKRNRLDADTVRAIRAAYACGGVTQLALANRFGVTVNTIESVTQHKTWRHLTCQEDASSSTSKETAYSIPLPASTASPQSIPTLVSGSIGNRSNSQTPTAP